MARRGRKKSPLKIKLRIETVYSIGAVALITIGLLIGVSFSGQGEFLQGINDVMRQMLGASSLAVPFLFISAGLILTGARWSFAKPQILAGGILLTLSIAVLGRMGSLGGGLYANFRDLLQPTGTVVLYSSVAMAGILMMSDTSLKELFSFIKSIFVIDKSPKDEEDKEESSEKDKKGILPFRLLGQSRNATPSFKVSGLKDEEDLLKHSEKVSKEKQKAELVAKSKSSSTTGEIDQDLGKKIEFQQSKKLNIYQLPPISLLDAKHKGKADRGNIQENVRIIESTLMSFNIEAKVKNVSQGPAVTQYQISVPAGKKVSKVTSLANDLALALAASTGQIRIEAPIPGTNLVGIEVPNKSPSIVSLHSMLTSEEMQKEKSKLAISLGFDVSGKPVVADIGSMPHILIAGATGSGKSVAINAFLATILFRASPNEVKFIMVDPKRVELTPFNGIPHLLTPVIIDPKQVISALKWATHEMDRRYKLFAEVGVRNIQGYNEMSGFQAMPYIMIVIDELAEIMMFSPQEVEEAITRIAQLARAVGMHLVLATQRPSVDVITGLIKANIPARISFNVTSMTDSRVILDTPGAEKLLGKGDMLFIPPDQSKPKRVQGSFISEKEMKQLIGYLRSVEQAEYVDEITEKFQSVKVTGSASGNVTDLNDPNLLEAVEFLSENEKGASTTSLQRRFRWGFSKAGRIMDQMFEMGLVGEQSGSKPREINQQAVQEFIASRK